MPIIVKLFTICKNLISSAFVGYFVVKKGQNTEGVLFEVFREFVMGFVATGFVIQQETLFCVYLIHHKIEFPTE